MEQEGSHFAEQRHSPADTIKESQIPPHAAGCKCSVHIGIMDYLTDEERKRYGITT
ncbi:hypothetical protein [Ammoniphilus sp. 3BR4]|uniref:hypothetical protein n=1 Tax=Ammoniphilus sp. 3BR4 TaxID=3158265 RepID=UPI0034666863